MNIGKKNRLYSFWSNSGAVDEANQPVPDPWVFHKERWAEVKGETGMGAIRSSAGGINTPMDRYSLRINYTPSINEAMQARDPNGNRYDIVAVRHDLARREWTDVIVETGGANG